MHILDWLYSHEKTPKRGPGSEPGVKPAVPVAPPVEAVDDSHQRFVSKLNETLLQHADVVSGKVHLIGLEEIRVVFGDRWPRIAETAHKVARQAIEHKLAPSDLYTPYGDSNYMVVFTGLTRLEAQMKCAMIAREIAEKLLGTQGSEELLQVSTVVFKENGVLELKPVSDFDGLIQEFEAAWAEQKLKEREAIPRWETEEDQEKSWADLVSRIRYRYRPIWGARTRTIAAYGCRPMVGLERGAVLSDYHILPPQAPTRFFARLDLLALRRVAQDLVWTEREQKPVLLGVAVHYETLARTRTRIAYLSECQLIPERLRDKLLLEIVGVAEGVPASRLNELTGALSEECRAVMIRLPHDYARFDVIKQTKIFACGFDAAAITLRESEMFEVFDRFCEAVEAIRRRKYVHSLPNTSLLAAAVGSGFDYIDGEAIAGLQDQPEAAHTTELSDIFLRKI